MNTTFRRTTEQDINALKTFGISTLLPFLQNNCAYGFTAICENCVVGFAYGYFLIDPIHGRKIFYLHSIDIFNGYRGVGRGKAFMSYIRDYVLSNGFDEIFLATNIGNVTMDGICNELGATRNADDDVIYEWRRQADASTEDH